MELKYICISYFDESSNIFQNNECIKKENACFPEKSFVDRNYNEKKNNFSVNKMNNNSNVYTNVENQKLNKIKKKTKKKLKINIKIITNVRTKIFRRYKYQT